ncbi:GNAT family N-acetyltransferase [Fibrella aquatilis]|uniref:GNAT family N-acetyltransferase n=1 Tax=Fibrella aquatilis TaxID=2817059 RepID=A0A939GB42_9BACT|nr:GNAT family N-acetyltransferase [Fibrella aquatilis]MBO0934558.1 GNAT family N-acetyltransferase [Fibrella aquatilis]
MFIRLATPADIPQLVTLLGRVVPQMQASGNFQWDSTYPNATVFGDDISKQQLWVADINGQLAGVSAITTDQEPEYAQVGWDISEPAIVTHRLAVDPAFRGQGVGKALLQQAETVAQAKSIPRLRIDTNTQNQATQALFPAMGYVFAGEIGLGFRPGLRFYCYEKRLM